MTGEGGLKFRGLITHSHKKTSGLRRVEKAAKRLPQTAAPSAAIRAISEI